jgi:microcystin-dependent protein
LFDAISTTWDAGNGSTTFNIPDLRGATIRGAGTSSGFINTQNNQPDNVTVKLAQRDNDAIRDITGFIESAAHTGVSGVFQRTADTTQQTSGTISGTNRILFGTSYVVPTATENKVKARGCNFIIRLI